MEKLCYNVVVSPGEGKYRKIRLNNPKIKAAIVDEDMAMEVMKELGWAEGREEGEGGGRMLVLPDGVSLTMGDVRDIQNAQYELKKKVMSRTGSSASIKSSGSSEGVGVAGRGPKLVLQ